MADRLKNYNILANMGFSALLLASCGGSRAVGGEVKPVAQVGSASSSLPSRGDSTIVIINEGFQGSLSWRVLLDPDHAQFIKDSGSFPSGIPPHDISVESFARRYSVIKNDFSLLTTQAVRPVPGCTKGPHESTKITAHYQQITTPDLNCDNLPRSFRPLAAHVMELVYKVREQITK